MPIREYKCRRCGLVSEHLILSSSDRPEECPGCPGLPDALELVTISRSSFVMGRPNVGKVYTSDAQMEAEHGADWRETPGSRAMTDGNPIPERQHFDQKAKARAE